MDRFKPLIEYYENPHNIFYDILLSILLFIIANGFHLIMRSIINKKPNKTKWSSFLVAIFIVFFIYRPYRLKIISKYARNVILLSIVIIGVMTTRFKF